MSAPVKPAAPAVTIPPPVAGDAAVAPKSKDKAVRKAAKEAEKVARKAARKAKQNGKTPDKENGSDENSDQPSPNSEDKNIGYESDDDALTRKIKTEAQGFIDDREIVVNDDEWAVDMSAEAVKARQQKLPGEFKQKLVLNGDDEDEDVGTVG